MRKTNKDKWNELQVLLDQKKDNYFNDFFTKNPEPKFIYKATVSEIKAIPITRFKLRCDNEPRVWDKVTREDLKKLREFIDDFENLNKEIGCCYTEDHGTYKCSGAEGYYKVIEDKRMSFNESDLMEIQKQLHEKYAPRDGYKPCAYCGKQVPEDDLVSHQIIFQNSRPDPCSRSGYRKFVDKKTNLYCSGECAGYDQMAHEG